MTVVPGNRTRATLALAVVLAVACREAPPTPAPATPSPSVTPVASSTPSPSATSATTLPIPFLSEGACPFECCTYRTWTVERATEVRAGREAGAPVAFKLQPGEKVEALTGVVVVTRAGRARAPREVPVEGLGTLRAGDAVAVLHPLGEGFWLVWRDGKKGSAQVGAKPGGTGPGAPEVVQIEQPQFQWWIQVRDGKGRMGWTNEPGHFGNKDRCA